MLHVMIYLWVIKFDLRQGWSKQIMIIRTQSNYWITPCSHQGACNPPGLQHTTANKRDKTTFWFNCWKGCRVPCDARIKWDPRRLLGVKGLLYIHAARKKCIVSVHKTYIRRVLFTPSPRCTTYGADLYFQKACIHKFFIPLQLINASHTPSKISLSPFHSCDRRWDKLWWKSGASKYCARAWIMIRCSSEASSLGK